MGVVRRGRVRLEESRRGNLKKYLKEAWLKPESTHLFFVIVQELSLFFLSGRG